MRRAATVAAWVVVLMLAALVLWRIVATAVSDRLAREQPRQALEWDRGNPVALAALAQQQLERKEWGAARETALRLLEREPLSGQGFVVLATAAAGEGDAAQAALFSAIALRRAPHALGPPAWLLGEQLDQGRYADALDQVGRIWRIAPGKQEKLYPVLLALAEQPEFADALAEKLSARPVWRSGFMFTLINKASLQVIENVVSGLQKRGGLDADEMGRWIDRLVKDGQWGEAYARWASELPLSAMKDLTSVYNGGFENPPGGYGFDWRIGKSPDVIIDRDRPAGAEGSYAIRLRFLGRRTELIPLHQWLLLSPGSYRLRFRANAQDLRGDRGLQWGIRCLDGRTELTASDASSGTFDWDERGVAFVVPERNCQVQDLSLRNAGSKGAGKILSGTIWFDDLSIDRLDR